MKVLITGGCGFIGCNTADRFLKKGHDVVVFDNLSRNGTDKNLRWLREQGGSLTFIRGDIREYEQIRSAFEAHPDTDAVLHLAAQVAVTTSVTNPREDFEINALGTFNVLEALRETFGADLEKKFLLYASTNKVYGGMEDVAIHERNGRYEYKDLLQGVSESRLLDFHSPYGCSKGSADQYVVDYSRIYGLKTVSFRQSCIYGYRQFGVEDQGWVAWFIIAAMVRGKITVYGDGKQVRDVLFIEDLVDAYELALANRAIVSGKAYNVGGGPRNQLSLLELIAMIEERFGKKLEVSFDDWRPGDQRVFVGDISKIGKDLSWAPKRDVKQGVDLLIEWVRKNRDLFAPPAPVSVLEGDSVKR